MAEDSSSQATHWDQNRHDSLIDGKEENELDEIREEQPGASTASLDLYLHMKCRVAVKYSPLLCGNMYLLIYTGRALGQSYVAEQMLSMCLTYRMPQF